MDPFGLRTNTRTHRGNCISSIPTALSFSLQELGTSLRDRNELHEHVEKATGQFRETRNPGLRGGVMGLCVEHSKGTRLLGPIAGVTHIFLCGGGGKEEGGEEAQAVFL